MAAAPEKLYHMCEAQLWRDAQSSGTPYLPPTYDQDGFIHLSSDPSLLLTIANHFYTDTRGDWVVLVLDPARLSAEVKFEPAAPVGTKSSGGLLAGQQQEGQREQQQQREEPLFPHLYGSVDFEAVQQELPMRRSADGRFLGIEGLP